VAEPRSLGSYALIALVAGVALGLFSGVGDRLAADTVLHVVIALANAAGPWLVTAFAVGALAGAPLAGALTATAALAAAVSV
jgi:ABC-type dipeptide/oligopeptide/nickel transport system permease subunit